jgi:hypothetical protein
MEAINDLDFVLGRLSRQKSPTSLMEIQTLVGQQMHFGQLLRCIRHLQKLEYVIQENVQSRQGNEYYHITITGQLFYNKGGFAKQALREKWSNAWLITKTVATIAYSLAVLAVAIWAVYAEMAKP